MLKMLSENVLEIFIIASLICLRVGFRRFNLNYKYLKLKEGNYYNGILDEGLFKSSFWEFNKNTFIANSIFHWRKTSNDLELEKLRRIANVYNKLFLCLLVIIIIIGVVFNI